MKIRYILPFMGLLAIVSCKQNESIFNDDNNKAIFSGSIHQMQTRVSGTSWDASDTIGIFMVATGTNTISGGISNHAYVTTGDGYFSPSIEEQTIYYPLDKSAVDFVAYYPYRQRLASVYGVSNWNSSRQDTLDLLVANVSNKSQKDPEAELSFYHQFSKLVLNISANSETGLTDGDLAGMTVSIAGINKPAHCILLNKTVEYGESLTENVSMKVSADGKSASSIIPSTTGSSVIFTLADGSTYTWDISSQSFESGKLYPYAITLKATPNYVEATLGSVINDWNAVDSVAVSLDQDTLSEHEYVDLGLSVFWATCNLGANKPEDYGGYYNWGATTTGSNDYPERGIYTTKDTLKKVDDAAASNWGGLWKLPSWEEAKEIKTQCYWEWTDDYNESGISGFVVYKAKETSDKGEVTFFERSSKYNISDNHIFLPTAGHRLPNSTLVERTDEYAGFWTSVGNEGSAIYLAFSNAEDIKKVTVIGVATNYGYSVRPIISNPNFIRSTSVQVSGSKDVLNILETLQLCASISPSNATNPIVTWISSDDSIATVTDDGLVTALKVGSATITATSNDGSGVKGEYAITVTAPALMHNGHAYVDLGITDDNGNPIYWATCNVGSNSPEEYGDYFAWGETTGYNSGKTSFAWSNYKWMTSGQSSAEYVTKYTVEDGQTGCWYNGDTYVGTTVDGVTYMNKVVLDAEDDAATANWGGDWRMPTIDELKLLEDNCTWTWATLNNKNGYKGVGLNGSSIFLPAAGAHGDSFSGDGDCGNYWSSSLIGNSPCAYFMYFHQNSLPGYQDVGRCYGFSVRPVYSPSNN